MGFRCLCLWGGAFSRILHFGVETGTKTSIFNRGLVFLCLWDGAFNRNLYFGVQTGTKTNLTLVVYVYGMVLLIASCTSMYKQAPKRAFFQLFMFMGWCFYSHLVLRCTNRHQIKPIFQLLMFMRWCFSRILYFDVQTGTKTNLSLFVYVHGIVLSIATCTSMYKQAPKQTYLQLFMFTGWCFDSHLILWCTNRHQNKPIFSCLCLLGGAFTRILYFDVQTGTKTNPFLDAYVYEVVPLLASCTSMYKQAPKQTYLQLFMFMGWCFYSHLVLRCTNRHPSKPIQLRFNCLFVWGCFQSKLVLRCTNRHQINQKKNTYQFIVSRLLQHVDVQLPWSSVVWT